jgi:hypothetical protein
LIDCDFNWGLEIKLNGANGGTFFNDNYSINLNDFGYKTGDACNSTWWVTCIWSKNIVTFYHDQEDCANGDPAPNHEPCNVIVVTSKPNGPNPGPDPPALASLDPGIMDLVYT